MKHSSEKVFEHCVFQVLANCVVAALCAKNIDGGNVYKKYGLVIHIVVFVVTAYWVTRIHQSGKLVFLSEG